MNNKHQSDSEIKNRLLANIERSPDGCWNWKRAKDRDGYGKVAIRGKYWRAHRASYTFFHGEIPPGLVLDHLCRNPSCINPDHLRPVTNAENILAGEGWAAKRARQTHCKRGHELSGDNVFYVRKNRSCVECRRIRQREKSRTQGFRDAKKTPEARQRLAATMKRYRESVKARKASGH